MTEDENEASPAPVESERERLLREKAGARAVLAIIIGTIAFLELLIILQLAWE
jgi:hypothetical protein